MKRQIPLIIGILGFSAIQSLPALSQPNRIEHFFNGIHDNRGPVNGPLNQVQNGDASLYRDARQSDDEASSATSGNRMQRNADGDRPYEFVRPDTQKQPDAAPGTQKQNRVY